MPLQNKNIQPTNTGGFLMHSPIHKFCEWFIAKTNNNFNIKIHKQKENNILLEKHKITTSNENPFTITKWNLPVTFINENFIITLPNKKTQNFNLEELQNWITKKLN